MSRTINKTMNNIHLKQQQEELEKFNKQWTPIIKINQSESDQAYFETRHVLLGQNANDQDPVSISKVKEPREFLDEIAQSSENLPNDFSTSSLVKTKGPNLSAFKICELAGSDYRKMIMIILQHQNIIDF